MGFMGFKSRSTKASKKKITSKEKQEQTPTSSPHSVAGTESTITVCRCQRPDCVNCLFLQQIIAAVKAEVVKEMKGKKLSGDSSVYTANIQKRFDHIVSSKSTAGISLLTEDVREPYDIDEDDDSIEEMRDEGTVENTKEESPASFDCRIRKAPSGESCWVELKLKDTKNVDNDYDVNDNETREPEIDVNKILYSDYIPLKNEWAEGDDEKQKSNMIPSNSNDISNEIVSSQREIFKAPSGESCWIELRLKIPTNEPHDEKAIEDISNKKSPDYVSDEDSGNEDIAAVENNGADTTLGADTSATYLEHNGTPSTDESLRLAHQRATVNDVEDCQEAVETPEISENDTHTDVTKAKHEVLAEQQREAQELALNIPYISESSTDTVTVQAVEKPQTSENDTHSDMTKATNEVLAEQQREAQRSALNIPYISECLTDAVEVMSLAGSDVILMKRDID